jgi:hypothetical protein
VQRATGGCVAVSAASGSPLRAQRIAVTSDIMRRDFLNGFALTIAAGLTPLRQMAWAQHAPYPPALTGLTMFDRSTSRSMIRFSKKH